MGTTAAEWEKKHKGPLAPWPSYHTLSATSSMKVKWPANFGSDNPQLSAQRTKMQNGFGTFLDCHNKPFYGISQLGDGVRLETHFPAQFQIYSLGLCVKHTDWTEIWIVSTSKSGKTEISFQVFQVPRIQVISSQLLNMPTSTAYLCRSRSV